MISLTRSLRLPLIKRSFDPAKGNWSLEGGFVEKDESLDEAACRVLLKYTGLSKERELISNSLIPMVKLTVGIRVTE